MKIYGMTGIALGAVCLFFGAAAPSTLAQDAAKSVTTPMINAMDSNGDGKASQAEMKTEAQNLWKKADVNKDGKLTVAEDEANSKKRFESVDANHDGQISEEEYVFFWVGSDDPGRQAYKEAKKLTEGQAAPAKGAVLELSDKNGDGQISLVEAAEYRRIVFKQYDADSNGKLTLDEYVRGRDQAFKVMDANSDGVVVEEEYITYWVGKKAGAAPKPSAAPAKGK